jgi:hypothetical protein
MTNNAIKSALREARRRGGKIHRAEDTIKRAPGGHVMPMARHQTPATGGGSNLAGNLAGLVNQSVGVLDKAGGMGAAAKPGMMPKAVGGPTMGGPTAAPGVQGAQNPMAQVFKQGQNQETAFGNPAVMGIPRAGGGQLPLSGTPGQGAQDMFQGPLHSQVPGRTDRIKLNVKPGSYVVPADVTSMIGEGNTHAGTSIINMMFPAGNVTGANQPPKGKPGIEGKGSMKGASAAMMTSKKGAGAKKPGLAEGGDADDDESTEGSDAQPNLQGQVPIIAAGGEVVLSPEQILNKFGDLDLGHKSLDAWILHERQKEIQRLKTAPPPKK